MKKKELQKKTGNKKFTILISVIVLFILSVFILIFNPDLIPFVNKREKAQKYIDKASELLSSQKPGSSNNIILQSRAQQELDKALELEPENENALLLRASISINTKNYDEGFVYIEKLLKINPVNTDAYYYRASGKMQKGEYESSIEDFSKLLSINSNYVDAYFYRGQIKYLLKDYKGAEEDFTKMIELRPGISQGYASRGITRVEMGMKDSACADLQKAKYIDNLNSKGRLDLDSLINLVCKK